MIQPDAKCINNGKKLNETIVALNNILNVVVSEEFEIVDTNNQPSKRWFFTGKLTGQKQDSDTGDQNRLGNTPSNKNRDKLDKGAAPIGNGAGGVMPAGMVKPGSQAAKDGFNDTPRMGGAMVRPGSQAAKDGFNDTPRMGGAMVKPGSQAAKDGFDDAPRMGGAMVKPGSQAAKDGFDDTRASADETSPTGDTTPNTKNKLSPEASAFGQILAAKTQRDNQEANQRIYEKAAAIRANNKKKTEQARVYKAKTAAGNLERKAVGDKLAAKAAEREQSNIKEASSPDRTAKITALKKQLMYTVRELARVDGQIARDRSNRKIHSSSSPLMKRREQLEAERKRISSEMTSL